MFKKIVLAFFTFSLLFSSFASLSVNANNTERVQKNSNPSSLWAGDKPVTFSSDENLANEPIDEVIDSEENEYKPTSICGGPCPIIGATNDNNLTSLQSASTFNQKSPTLTFATSVLRFIFSIISGLSFFTIVGGLITAVILSIIKKKIAVAPLIVFGCGILFLVVSIIGTTIISLGSFF
jgi:hypothetical protein